MAEKQTIFIAHNWSCVSVSSISYYLALELSKQHRVVFLNGKGPRNVYTRINENLEVYDWPNKRPVKFKDFVFFVRLLRKYKPNAVLAHFSTVSVCVVGAWLFKVKRNCCYYHTLIEQNRLDLPANKSKGLRFRFAIFKKGLVYKLASNIIAVSQYAKLDVSKHFKVDAQKVKVIYNGMPDTACKNNFDALKIVFAGRCDYSKGIDVLINAVGLLLNRGINLQLEVAGGGKQRAQLEEHIQLKGWQNAIKFIGPVPYGEIHQFISSAYLIVVPSRIDNLPTVVIEAKACMVPVIGAAVGGIPEMIEHKKNGLLFKAEDSGDLAEQIFLLINDRQLRDNIAAAGRKQYEDCFTIEKNVRDVRDLLLHGPRDFVN